MIVDMVHRSYENDHVSLRIRVTPPEAQQTEGMAHSATNMMLDGSVFKTPLERTSSRESAGNDNVVLDVRARHIPRRLTV